MGELAPILTAAGGYGVLAVVIGYLLSSNRADRKEYQEAIAGAEKRADAAEQRAEALQQTVDDARAARRAAEDKADDLTRQLARQSGDVP